MICNTVVSLLYGHSHQRTPPPVRPLSPKNTSYQAFPTKGHLSYQATPTKGHPSYQDTPTKDNPSYQDTPTKGHSSYEATPTKDNQPLLSGQISDVLKDAL